MTKKIDEPFGVSISPEFGEVARRLKSKTLELEEIAERTRREGQDNGETANEGQQS